MAPCRQGHDWARTAWRRLRLIHCNPLPAPPHRSLLEACSCGFGSKWQHWQHGRSMGTAWAPGQRGPPHSRHNSSMLSFPPWFFRDVWHVGRVWQGLARAGKGRVPRRQGPGISSSGRPASGFLRSTPNLPAPLSRLLGPARCPRSPRPDGRRQCASYCGRSGMHREWRGNRQHATGSGTGR